MTRFLACITLLSLGSIVGAADHSQAAPPEPKDMRSIFNGNDLTGWDGDPRLWSVKDGAIRGETTTENKANGNTFIIWKDGKKVTGTLIDAAGYEKLFKLDDWNDVVIIAKGTHIQHYLNNRLILDFTDSPERALLDGILAFQLHAGKPMWVEF